MQWIKIPLVLVFIGVLVTLFRNRQRVELRAGTRVIAILLGAVAVASVIDPDIPQRVATALGVGRGTDLLLYVLVVVFVLTTLGLTFRLRESDHRVRRLARSVAIHQAIDRDGPVGILPPADGFARGPDLHDDPPRDSQEI